MQSDFFILDTDHCFQQGYIFNLQNSPQTNIILLITDTHLFQLVKYELKNSYLCNGRVTSQTTLYQVEKVHPALLLMKYLYIQYKKQKQQFKDIEEIFSGLNQQQQFIINKLLKLQSFQKKIQPFFQTLSIQQGNIKYKLNKNKLKQFLSHYLQKLEKIFNNYKFCKNILNSQPLELSNISPMLNQKYDINKIPFYLAIQKLSIYIPHPLLNEIVSINISLVEINEICIKKKKNVKDQFKFQKKKIRNESQKKKNQSDQKKIQTTLTFKTKK